MQHVPIENKNKKNKLPGITKQLIHAEAMFTIKCLTKPQKKISTLKIQNIVFTRILMFCECYCSFLIIMNVNYIQFGFDIPKNVLRLKRS